MFAELYMLVYETPSIGFHFKNPGSSLIRIEWKPPGTPLVSLISCDDTIIIGDIQSIVYTMLSALLRTENSRHVDYMIQAQQHLIHLELSIV